MSFHSRWIQIRDTFTVSLLVKIDRDRGQSEHMTHTFDQEIKCSNLPLPNIVQLKKNTKDHHRDNLKKP